MKLLKRQILFSLASQLDFIKYAEGFQYYPYQFLYQRLPGFQTSSIRAGIGELIDSSLVDKIIRNNTPLFRLTARGREKLLSFFPLSLGQRRVWDRTWKIAIINSENRKQKTENRKQDNSQQRQLRQTLKKLSFVRLARGVYLTPMPITSQLREYLLTKDFSANIAVIESRRLILGDDKHLAKYLWRLDELIKKYQNLINRLKILLIKKNQSAGLNQQVKKQFPAILSAYFSLLEEDSGLPKKLLPSDWPAEKLRELFLTLSNQIS